MLNTIIIIIMILCVLLAFVILIQNPKGGGLSSAIGGFSNQTMGVQRTTESLEKASWYLMGVIAFLVLITGTSLFIPEVQTNSENGIEQINSDLNKTYPGEPRTQQAPQGIAPAPLPTGDNAAPNTQPSSQQAAPETPAENTPAPVSPAPEAETN